jgi:signal transduction histidine kinase
MLAHELRSPLSPIRTGLQVLRVTESQDMAARVRSMIERQVGNLCRLIDDLLDVSRITRGRISLKKEAVEIFRTRSQGGSALD